MHGEFEFENSFFFQFLFMRLPLFVHYFILTFSQRLKKTYMQRDMPAN